MLENKEHYADDVTDILVGQGFVENEEAEQFKKYLRGW